MNKRYNLRATVVSAIMGSLSFVLMLLAFNIPIVPSFLEFDISELPALITSFTFGPLYGVLVCLIKNLLHLFITKSVAVGELSNFLLGAVFVFVAGTVYKYNKTRKGALLGSLLGAVFMAVASVATNYFIVYPMYAAMFMPMEAIMGAYRTIMPGVKNLFSALCIFNLPFTLAKGIVDAAICFAVYKKLSPILKKNL